MEYNLLDCQQSDIIVANLLISKLSCPRLPRTIELRVGGIVMNAAEGPGRALIDQTVSQLEHLIFRGELKPGDKLSEQALSSRFGISRGPPREAIRSLEGRRLVERVPFAGVRVVQLTVDDIEQLLVTREALEGMACRQAAENMTLHETRRLCKSLAELERKFREEGPSGVFRNGAADNDLHIQIARGSRNRWLIDIICGELYPRS